jgi:prephenate dehydrogenase
LIPFRQITIIGTGLIGGSFALGARKHGFRGQIVGCDGKEVLARARRKGAIDRGVTDAVSACQGSDLILLAMPVGGIIELLAKLAPQVSPGALITDVGSTKAEVVRAASQAFGNNVKHRFLAGHPMAGKENSGIEYADAELFRGAVWFLTPVEQQKLKAGKLASFTRLIKSLGAKVSILDPAQHDELCAWISHVPQMISTALAATLVEEFGENAPLLESGGRALREMTRISASPYSMWRDIALTNKKPIRDALLKLEQELAHIRENLDTRELEAAFRRAHQLQRTGSPRRHSASEKHK